MRIIRAYQLVKSFNSKELKKLTAFLSSSYHCQQSELLELTQILSKVPFKKGQKNKLPFDTLELYDKLYTDGASQNKEFRQKKIMNVISDLTLKLETFIAIEQLKKDEMKKLHYVNSFLSSRNSQKASVLSRNKWKRQIYREPDTIDKYINRYYCYRLEFESLYNDRLKKETSEPYLRGMDQQASYVYWFARLSYLCHQLFRAPIMAQSDQLIPEVRSTLEASKNFVGLSDQFPTINTYRRLLQLGQEFGQKKAYQSCLQFFKLHVKKTAPSERANLLQFLLNYCQSSFSKGYVGFMKESFHLITWGLEVAIISKSEMSSDAFFINHVVGLIAIQSDEQEIEQYIQEYSHFVPIEYRQDALNTVRAYRNFHNQNLQAALDALNQIEHRNHYYMVRIQSLQLRIFYQLFVENLFLLKGLKAKVATFKKYFENDKLPLSQTRKNSYLRLVWFVREMTHFHTPSHKGGPDHYSYLEKELNTQTLQCKAWVQQQLGKLKPS